MPEKPQKNEKTAKTDPAAPPPAEDRSVSAATAWRLIVLEVSLRPTQTRRGPEVELSLPLPRTLLSDLQIDVTGEPRETLRAPRGFLGTAQDRALQGSLEPTSELRLIVSPINAPLTSEQYSVRVRSFTETSGEFARRLTFGRYKIERGEVSLIAWKLPPRSVVQTDRIQATQLAGTQIRRTADETLVLLEFSPPQTSDFDVVLPWLLAEPPIEGDRKFTWARPVSASHASASNTSAAVEIREHQAGIAAVAGLTVKTDAGLLSSNATDIEQSFLASWPAGTSVRRPQLVFDAASASPPNWRVQPISVDRTARWNAVARISRDSIEWIFTCEVELSGAPAFVHELDVASRLKVESVAVLQDDVSRLRHWAQFENRLLLHLRDRSTGQQTIRIVARESIAAGQSINPPKIELVGARAFESHLHLSRNREVTVDVQGVEAADSTVPESTTEDADFAFVGHYRLRAISDAALLVTPLPTVSRSWCVATIDRSEEDPSVELAINLAAGRLRATTLRLPNWPLAQGASWDLDGDPATTMTPSSTEPGVWLIQLRQRLDLPLLIRLRVPLLFADDDMPLLLAAPELQGVTEQTIGWVAPSQLEGTPAASAVLPANKQTELLARGIVAPVIASSSIVDWSQSRLPVSRTEHDVNANAELPALFAHRVQLGHHDRTSGVTRLLAGGSAQTLLRLEWPTSIRVTACTLNGRLTNIGTIANGQLAVPLDESSGLATVELYWEHTESGQSLRIAQRVLPLVKVFGVRKVVERAVVMSPKTRSVLTTAPVSSDDWRSARQTWSELLTNRPRLKRGPVAELLNSVSTDFAADVVKSDVPLAQPTTAGHIDRREVVVTNHNELRYWVVDERLSEFLLSFFLALIAAPLILVLVRLKTGEALSRWPAASATLLTLIWWFCLQGSALGFAAAALAATVALLHALRHMLAQP